jgi:pimeloyl-ACP methyl ester carboxylesterase
MKEAFEMRLCTVPRSPRPRLARLIAAAVAVGASSMAFPASAVAPPPAAPAVPKTPEAKVPLALIAHVEVRGNGPIPMILIPGVACDWTIYDTFMTRNAQKYTMYAITLPGFGGSPPPADPKLPATSDAWLTNAELAILQLIEERKIDHPVVVGHSFGGHLAYRLAARHGDAFRAAVSIDGMTWIPLQELTKGNVPIGQRKASVEGQLGATILKQKTDAQWKSQALENAPQLSKDKARGEALGKMMGSVPAAVAGRYFLEYIAGDLTDEVPQIKIPTLAIIAISDIEDPLRPKIDQRSLRLGQVADAPAVTAVVLDDTRNLVVQEQPEQVDSVIAAFLSGKPVPNAAKTGTLPGNAGTPGPGVTGGGIEKK